MPTPAAGKGKHFSDGGNGGQSLDDKNRAVMGDEDDEMGDGQDDDMGDGQDDADDLNDNSNGDESDTGADDNADGGQGDAGDVQQPNPKDVARRGSGKPVQKPMQKAKAEDEDDKILTVMDANQFMETITKAMAHNFETYMAENGPEMIDAALGRRLSVIEKRMPTLEKSLGDLKTTLGNWFAHYDERTDDVEEKQELIEKALGDTMETFNLIKSNLLGDTEENLLGDNKPKLTPLKKSVPAAPGGKVLNPAGDSGHLETRGKKILRLCKAADDLQEKTGKPVDGYTDAWVTIQNGGQLPESALERLEKGVTAAEGLTIKAA
jgi:hypothetical protein